MLVERHSRFYIMEKIDAISQDAVAHALHRMLRSGTMKKVLSITTDNGSEFLDSDRLTHVLGKHHPEASIYYTHAYASWEKGSVENTNRMARRWYPKGTDFSRVAKERVKALQDFINSIARKTSLKGKTAHEVFSTAA